jgi:glutamine synthetase
MSLALPNTVLNTIVAEAIDDLAGKLKTALKGSSGNLEKAVAKVVKESWTANKRIVFDGDNYAPEWHAEAKKRGLYNLRSTPDALPWLVDKGTVALFKKYKVLSKRELESRHEVFLEQYATKINIESETAAAIARTEILPASVRYLNELKASDLEELIGEVQPLIKELHFAILKLEDANLKENQDDKTAVKWAAYMHDRVIPAMDDVRDVADRLEGVVADDLWPLPKYSEMLFIK